MERRTRCLDVVCLDVAGKLFLNKTQAYYDIEAKVLAWLKGDAKR